MPVLEGVRDVALIHYGLCTDSIKPSLQFLCYFVVINASEGSLCFQNFIMLKLVLVAWTVTCTYHYVPLSSMIRLNQTEPATFHFQFCRIGLSLRILIFLYFIATSALFVPCGGCKRSLVHSIRDVIFPIL
jgi:hypothetical protein